MTKRTCIITGCERPQHARQMCPSHWAKDRRTRLGIQYDPVPCDLCGEPMARTRGASMSLHRECKDKMPLWQREGRAKGMTPQREARLLTLWQGPKNNPRRDKRGDIRAGYEDKDYARFIRGIKRRVKISKSGCWEWQGQLKRGYAQQPLNGRNVAVHRIVIEAREGKPLGVLAAHHRCANTTCVNPDHLQAVTSRENMAEMITRTSLENRIIELEMALIAIDPSHEALNRVGALSGGRDEANACM